MQRPYTMSHRTKIESIDGETNSDNQMRCPEMLLAARRSNHTSRRLSAKNKTKVIVYPFNTRMNCRVNELCRTSFRALQTIYFSTHCTYVRNNSFQLLVPIVTSNCLHSIHKDTVFIGHCAFGQLATCEF